MKLQEFIDLPSYPSANSPEETECDCGGKCPCCTRNDQNGYDEYDGMSLDEAELAQASYNRVLAMVKQSGFKNSSKLLSKIEKMWSKGDKKKLKPKLDSLQISLSKVLKHL